MKAVTRNSIANYITIGNIAFGCLSLLSTLNARYELAALFIFLAVLMDTTDGRVARRLDIISELGRELDSLCDLVSFGVAPALLIYSLLPGGYEWLMGVLAIIYIVCGAYRLARFNVLRNEQYFIGVPITLAGLLMAVAALCQHYLPDWLLMSLLPALSFLMVCNIKVKKLHS